MESLRAGALVGVAIMLASGSEGRADKGGTAGELSVDGRVFVRAAVVDDDANTEPRGLVEVRSARVAAKYKWETLRAEVEVELESQKLKDAYLRLRAFEREDVVRIDIRAGQFKMPFSGIQLQSVWRLPVAERGLLDIVLADRLQVAGRHVGGEIDVEVDGGWKPSVAIGVFQGTNDAGDPLSASLDDGFGQNLGGRVSVQPIDGLDVGLAASLRSGQLLAIPVTIRHRGAVEIDARVETTAGRSTIRLWAEALYGTSWLVAGDEPGKTRAHFVGGRAISGWRIGGADHGQRFVEPYVLFGLLDPDLRVGNDRVAEVTAGVSTGAWDVWRLQLEGQIWRVGENAPLGIVEQAAPPGDVTTVLLQLGARF